MDTLINADEMEELSSEAETPEGEALLALAEEELGEWEGEGSPAGKPVQPKRRVSKLDRRENFVAFLFILIPIIGFLVFTACSICFSFVYSFHDYHVLTGAATFIGGQNYERLFTDLFFAPDFANSVKNTVVLLLSIPFSMILGMGFAALLRMGDIRGSRVFQILYYLPAVSSAVAVNIVWRYIFNNEFGVINQLIGVEIPWLSDPVLIKVAIIFKNSINGLGTAMILYLAGMLSVPKDYYEASELEGAGKIRQFFSITLPLTSPVTFYLLITGLIGGLQSYADSQVFGAGNEGSRTIVYFIWARGIDQGRYGLASAASILLAATIMIITLVQFKFSNKWVYEE